MWFKIEEIMILKAYLSKQIDKRRVELYRNVKRLNNADFDKIVGDIKYCSMLINEIESAPKEEITQEFIS
jgi:hypothetical protein